MKNNRIFDGTSKYYALFRPSIPDEVVRYVIERYNIEPEGTLLDMGCGTGISTRAFAPFFKKTIAFDVNEQMLNEAIRIDNRLYDIDWRLCSDKEVSLKLNSIDLAIACRSFNWMDQYPLLQNLHKILKPGGVVSIIGDGSFWTGKEPWQKKIKEIVQEFLGEKRRAGKTNTYSAPVEPYIITLENNGYIDIDYKIIPVKREWTIDTIIGYLYSTSFSAWSLYDGKNREFEERLVNELMKANNNSSIFIEYAEFSIQSGVNMDA